MTSSVTHNVRLPRRRRPASYANQFFTRNFIFGMWWRRAALCLFGMDRIASPLTIPASLLDSDGLHATTPRAPILGKKRERPRQIGILVDPFKRLAPSIGLKRIHRSQIKNLPLHHPSVVPT